MIDFLRFELYRNKRNWRAFIGLVVALAAFSTYAFTLHLNTILSSASSPYPVPLNLSYAAFALRLPLCLTALIVALAASLSVQRDIETRLIDTMLSQSIERTEYFWGKSLFFEAVLAASTALLAVVSLLITSTVFAGRYPITQGDVEIAGARYLLLFFPSVALVAVLGSPIVVAAQLAAFLGAPVFAIALVLVGAGFCYYSAVAKVLNVAVLVDYKFDFKQLSLASPTDIAVLLVSAIILLILVAVARKTLYKRELR